MPLPTPFFSPSQNREKQSAAPRKNTVLTFAMSIKTNDEQQSRISSDVSSIYSVQWGPTAFGCSDSRLFGILEHLRFELCAAQALAVGGRPRPDGDRPELARFGHLLDEEIPRGRDRAAAGAVAAAVLAVLLRTAVGQDSDQLAAAVPALHHHRGAADVAAQRADRAAAGRVQVLHQDLRGPQLRLHLG